MLLSVVVIIAIVCVLTVSSVRIVPNKQVRIIERLGEYKSTIESGVYVMVPFIDRCVNKVTMKEQLRYFNPQTVITKDNIAVKIDGIISYIVTDPVTVTYSIDEPSKYISNLIVTKLKVAVGNLRSDEVYANRLNINSKVNEAVNEITNKWGIKLLRVEIRDIVLPESIVIAMERKTCAEYERKRILFEADTYKLETITRAKADKQAKIIRAEATPAPKQQKKSSNNATTNDKPKVVENDKKADDVAEDNETDESAGKEQSVA